MNDLRGQERLIVALDVPTHDQAFALVDSLDNVVLFKVGWELLMAGDLLGFIQRLQERRANKGGVFIDLKLSGDIGNTVSSFVRRCLAVDVKFLTLVETVPLAITLSTVQAARAARGAATTPRLLAVPVLSSLDGEDLRQSGIDTDLNAYIVGRAKVLLDAGCDGLIVSGDAIHACRNAFGPSIDIVSPGIRPAWAASSGGHKRHTTPSEAIKLGSDYLVVGRPIVQAPNPRAAAQHVIDEIDAALDETQRSSGSDANSGSRANSGPRVAQAFRPA